MSAYRIGAVIRYVGEAALLYEVWDHAHWSVFLMLLLITSAMEIQFYNAGN